MKLSGLKKSFLPIVISGIAMNSSPGIHTFLYNQSDEIEDAFVSKYVENTFSNNYTDLLARVRFNEYYKNWSTETMFASSPSTIMENRNFIEICKLGEQAVKPIAEKLREKPSHLVWAYNIIFGFKISDDPSTTISEASRLWLKYLKKQSIIE